MALQSSCDCRGGRAGVLRKMILAGAATTTVLSASQAMAQPTWRLAGLTVDMSGDAMADEGCGAAVSADALRIMQFTQQANGDYLARVPIWVEDQSPCPPNGPSFVYSDAVVMVRISGEGTRRLTFSWNLIAKSRSKAIDGFVGQALTDVTSAVAARINYPAALPVFVNYAWEHIAALETRTEAGRCFFFGPPPPPEAPPDAGFTISSFDLFGTERFGGRFTAVPPIGADMVFIHKETDSGQINAFGQNVLGAGIDGRGFAFINFAGDQAFCGYDYGIGRFKGQVTLTLSVPGQDPPPTMECTDVFEFSLDIGSDSELSDNGPVGTNNWFDPGDTYRGLSGTLGGPNDGTMLDDESLFPPVPGMGGGDPAPDDDTGTILPLCNMGPVLINARRGVDLDGIDRVDNSGLVRLIDPTAPLDAAILGFQSASVRLAENLVLSVDDDGPAAWVSCDTPVNVPTPSGLAGHGNSTDRDELIGLGVHPANPMVTTTKPFGICDEQTLHVDLAPNPDGSLADDDDVDALDIHEDVDLPLVLFSVDHEASRSTRLMGAAALDPGDVYYSLPGQVDPLVLIDDVIHLGLSNSTDLDAIELVFVEDPLVSVSNTVLALLFSVSADDPGTAGNESGGLNPGQIYMSYLTGSSVPLLDEPLDEDIDALANACHDYFGSPLRVPCRCDWNRDGVLDSQDYFDFISAFFSGAADFNGDGITDSQDYFEFISCFFTGCP